ncbi:MAG: GHKL domain-containing protein [Lachnospiraceae bacterium]|nr:GHKL domain-containing protein [Lachnospiraceae bacterium]
MTVEDYQQIFHEIKNNITFISSSLQFVEKKHPKVKDYSSWHDAMEEVNALKKMLVDLSSARLCDTINFQQISVQDFLNDLCHSCKNIFESPDFSYEIQCENTLPDILIDTTRLKRAFSNLLKNAYEAMEEQGIVTIRAYSKENFVVFEIIDTGGGIEPEYLSKIFTPFETTKENGTGLGLLITKQIVHAHNGQITIDSRPGDGSTFSVLIPCASNIL